jgi:DNA-binding SARP family transcriptional activator
MRDTPLDEALALYERAGELLAGELLAGLPYEWLTPPGKLPLDEQYAGMLPKLRESLARRCAASGRPAQAAAFYEQILQDEPLKEEIVRQLMLCYAALGDRRGLRNAERNLRLAFRREWGNERDDIADKKYNPSPPTATLFARLDAELAARERENSGPVAEFPTGTRPSAHQGVTVASVHGGTGH